MKKFEMFKIDIQLFAEPGEQSESVDPGAVEFEIETDTDINPEGVEIDEGQEVKSEYDGDDDGSQTDEERQQRQEVNADEGEQKETLLDDPQEKMVPLKALEAERKKWKERLDDPKLKKAMAIAEKLAAATGKDIDSVLADMDGFEVQKHVENGMSEEQAKAYVQMQRKIEDMERRQNAQKYDVEFAQLKQSSFYADADNYRDELETFSQRTGLSIKQAYNALYADNKMADMERQIEQRVLNNLQKKQGKRIDTTPNGTVNVQPKVKLSADELAIAKAAGMSPQEYYNMKNVSSIDGYKKTKK